MSGLGAPHWEPGARGLISGLTRASGPPEVSRAAFEAVAHQVADVLERVEHVLGTPIGQLHADGGAIRSDLLATLVADLSGIPVLRCEEPEVAALGAALLAGVHAGIWPDLDRRRPRSRGERAGSTDAGCRRARAPAGRSGRRRFDARHCLGKDDARWRNSDDVRLIAEVARLYYEHGLKQPEIARRLHLSQAKVSRLLRQAIDRDIVRISVRVPVGVHAELEEELESKYGLIEAVVVETSPGDEQQLMRDLGHAAAYLLETTIRPHDVIGISSWSATLLAMVNAMRPVTAVEGVRVVQILGGVGNPAAEVHATELTRRLAQVLDGEPILLPVPGVVGSIEARRVLESDEHVRRVLEMFSEITVALVGIGTVAPSPMLARSGNVFSDEELAQAAEAGAVGDISLRFFDADGKAARTPLDERVIGLDLDQLQRVPRSIAVAGGERKAAAIEAALTGRLVSHLVTDRYTALRLLELGGNVAEHGEMPAQEGSVT